MRRALIATARLYLRAMAKGDLALFRDLYTDAATMRHIGRPVSPEWARASFRATLEAAREPHGPRFFVIVERRRRVIGLCSVQAVAQHERSVEIGIMLRPDARRRQYATEALSALTAMALRTLPIDTVWAQYRTANRGAARLFDALGFSEIEGWRPRGARPRLCVRIVRRPGLRSNQPKGAVPMSNVIGFLENAGRDAALRHASREQLLQAMQREEIEPAIRAAMLQPERMAIDGLQGGRDTMYCVNRSTPPPKPMKAPAKKAPAKAPPKKAPPKKK
ncbi:MAG TPA: GNAT family N-acetyltransferase [Xanthomonadaceae bacterium]|jgi:RimJ/RimL family protein N-acetyltransferase